MSAERRKAGSRIRAPGQGTPATSLPLTDLAAKRAEAAGDWHVAAQQLALCLESAGESGDERSFRRFAARLSLAYGAMRMDRKAEYFRMLAG